MPRLAAVLSLFLLLSVAAVMPGTPWQGWLLHWALSLQGQRELTEEERAIFYVDDDYWFGEEPPDAIDFYLHEITSRNGETEVLIEVDGERGSYQVGDELADTEVYLSTVLEDAVLLWYRGSYSLLWKRNGSRAISLVKDPMPWVSAEEDAMDREPELVDLRHDREATRIARHYRDRLYRNPVSLIGTIQVEVEAGGPGERVFRIAPGRDREAFRKFELAANDRVVGINGVGLGEPEGLSRLYETLADAAHLTVTLSREGQAVVVLLSLQDGPQAAER